MRGVVVIACWLAACSATYEPVCRGEATQPLAVGELAQPSGLTLVGDRVYVANAASVAALGDYDYCASFLTVFDAATGKPVGNPIMPRDQGGTGYRFFSDITYDAARNALLIAERQTGSILKVDPESGRILARAEAGHGPYSLRLLGTIATTWDAVTDTTVRDILAVADLGNPSTTGRVWLIDLDAFSSPARNALPANVGRPAGLDFDAATATLFVAYVDQVQHLGVDVRTLRRTFESEPIAFDAAPQSRALAIATRDKRLYFSVERPAYAGLWAVDLTTGELTEHLPMRPAPAALAVADDWLLGLAPKRLYVMRRQPLALLQTIAIPTASPGRMLVDATRRKVFLTSFDPSRFLTVPLP